MTEEVVVNIFGVPVSVSPWTLILGVIISLDAYVYIKSQWKKSTSEALWLAAVIVMLFVVLSVFVHELSHAVVSFSLGNPISQAGISWWGAYVQPTYSLQEMGPLAEIFIVLAGPLSNLFLAAIAVFFVWLLKESLPENTIQYFAYINWRLFLFNLIPIWVLDGGKFFHGLVWGFSGSYSAASISLDIVSWLILAYLLIGRHLVVDWKKKRGITTKPNQFSVEEALKKL